MATNEHISLSTDAIDPLTQKATLAADAAINNAAHISEVLDKYCRCPEPIKCAPRMCFIDYIMPGDMSDFLMNLLALVIICMLLWCAYSLYVCCCGRGTRSSSRRR